MDETTKLIIDKVTVKCNPPKDVGCGVPVTVFYDCAKLSPSDLARLAAEAIGHLPEDAFDMAVGLAYTGVFFAAAVAGGREVGILQADGKFYGPALQGKKVILVDDVVYQGKRMAEAATKLGQLGAKIVGCACIVDRGASTVRGGQCPQPLWSALQDEL